MRAAVLALLVATAAGAQGYRPNVSFRLDALGVQEAVLGEALSLDTLTLTNAAPGEDSVRIREMTYIRMCPSSVNPNCKFRFNPDYGIEFNTSVLAAPGGTVWTDSLRSRQGSRPVQVDEPFGIVITCTAEASLGTCGTGTLIQGTMKTLCATASSRTRTCTCTASADTSPTYAWALAGGSGTVGNSTTCPGVTP